MKTQWKQYVKILGIISVISYMICILFTWMLANYLGYTYFTAGEPILIIKYIEWVCGGIGMWSLFVVYKEEIEKINNSISTSQSITHGLKSVGMIREEHGKLVD